MVLLVMVFVVPPVILIPRVGVKVPAANVLVELILFLVAVLPIVLLVIVTEDPAIELIPIKPWLPETPDTFSVMEPIVLLAMLRIPVPVLAIPKEPAPVVEELVTAMDPVPV